MSDYTNAYEVFLGSSGETDLWIRRSTWTNTCALVVSVGAFKGKSPYFGNPEIRVDLYDSTTGELKARNAKLPCPGCYQWERVARPHLVPKQPPPTRLDANQRPH